MEGAGAAQLTCDRPMNSVQLTGVVDRLAKADPAIVKRVLDVFANQK